MDTDDIGGGDVEGGETQGGEMQDGEVERGEAQDGEVERGEAQEGEAERGEAQGGEVERGEAQDGEAERGEAQGGEVERGEVQGGEKMKVDMNYRDRNQESDSDEEDDATQRSESSDEEAMDTTLDVPKAGTTPGVKLRRRPACMTAHPRRPVAQKPVAQKPHPKRNPRKRPRLASSKSGSDEENPAAEYSGTGTRENPIDLDLYVSIWEPTTATESVSMCHLSRYTGSHSFRRHR
jgi:hypothetical protein